jgi:cytochrome c553
MDTLAIRAGNDRPAFAEDFMKRLIGVVLLASLPSLAFAADGLDWAYPVTPKPEPLDSVTLKQMPGSDKQYTQAQIDDGFNPPDWFPGDHPAMPPIVANGVKPAVRACALCHLPTGAGHPESSGLAGLPANYIVRQMADDVVFKNGHRKGVRTGVMIGFANAISDADTRAAAEYFASLKPRPWTKVVETDTVPQTYIGPGAMRFATPGGGTEPIGNRIIVVPQDPARASSRDARSGFIDYVPTGSLAKGAALMAGGEGKTITCTICHGPTLKGLGEVPSIAGRPLTYIFRQLNDIKIGNRKGPWVELMKQVVEKLDDNDMIALSAYLGSLDP